MQKESFMLINPYRPLSDAERQSHALLKETAAKKQKERIAFDKARKKRKKKKRK